MDLILCGLLSALDGHVKVHSVTEAMGFQRRGINESQIVLKNDSSEGQTIYSV